MNLSMAPSRQSVPHKSLEPTSADLAVEKGFKRTFDRERNSFVKLLSRPLHRLHHHPIVDPKLVNLPAASNLPDGQEGATSSSAKDELVPTTKLVETKDPVTNPKRRHTTAHPQDRRKQASHPSARKDKILALDEILSEFDRIMDLWDGDVVDGCADKPDAATSKSRIVKEANDLSSDAAPSPSPSSRQAVVTDPCSASSDTPCASKVKRGLRRNGSAADVYRSSTTRQALTRRPTLKKQPKNLEQFFSSYEQIVEPEFCSRDGRSLTGW